MRWLTRVRVSAGMWLTPLVALLVAANLGGQEGSGEGYRLAVATRDSFDLLLATGLCALAGAWEGGRLRRAGVLTWPRRRSVPRVLAAPWLMSVVSATAVAVIVFARHRAFSGGASMAVVTTTILSLWVWALAGIAAGLWSPPVVALPVSFAVPVLWLILAPVNSVPWLRHLNGDWVVCCQVDQTLAPAAVTGTLTVLAGVLVAAGLAIWGRSRTMSRSVRLSIGPGVVAALALGLVLGGVQVHHLGWEPVDPRHAAVACTTGERVTVCVLPEHDGQARHIVSLADAAFSRWQVYGVRTPTSLTEATGLEPGSRDAAALVANARYDTDFDILNQVSQALATASYQAPGTQVPVEVIQRQQRAQAWLVRSAGAQVGGGMDAARFGLDREAWDWATALLVKPRAQQGRTVNADLDYLAACR
ncbi:DUF7224 domain-containing protein [Acidipropionibacterium jensenii]|uniref:DUF7224 domain-containing protein n=1 Tax=Acidipropionibacterium jensenii TaxID=1749 RepID=A0A448NXD9_9ACTN|nr:hypothetical protein [Acidipropionibacterium jensenii]AZZ41746.1 hypothetical protein C0Z11_05020 [Acidipropionibacterium jensenii]MDN5995389.1 hypothetical protein [Acidipropionibacterium jensenii]MDN6657406.1 hypothetical protein [Acidipropionibacterium jensenii]QCV87071.1 hypothetical protein FEZ32_00640 [Acidipropionibacterium jensenii]VEI02611.1 Uncharacterised protein [Acidipropionibacterium jensenii]